MALANFFDKAALSAAQLLQNFNRESFEATLNGVSIGVSYDNNACSTSEGQQLLDLLVRLLSRLYPTIVFNDLSGSNPVTSQALTNLARSINPQIDSQFDGDADITVVIGKTAVASKGQVFYAGSDAWVMYFSAVNPVGSGNSSIAFGSGGAACLAASNVFRKVFGNALISAVCDEEVSLSLFSFNMVDANDGPLLSKVTMNKSLLVGIGAIGNGVLWSFQHSSYLEGEIIAIDHETITLSNLQRYVMAEQNDIDKSKVSLAEEVLSNSKLSVWTEPKKWTEYLNISNNWNLEKIAVCVDSAEDRIKVQSALPRKIFNSWTQPEGLGVSRHLDFLNEACLICLYLPKKEKISRSQELASNLRVPQFEPHIRSLLANNSLVDDGFMNIIAQANNVSQEVLKPFVGQHIGVFYSNVVCGGVMVKSADEFVPDTEVPAAFESAFAGILLAAEMVLDEEGILRPSVENVTRFNLMRPITKYLQDKTAKIDGCVCADNVWREAYKSKWR